MKDRLIRQQRCRDTIAELSRSRRCVFFTLTTVDVVGVAEIRERWRKFRNSLTVKLRRKGSLARYVMNYELHPGYLQKLVVDRSGRTRVLRGTGISHGWHIHGVMDCPVRKSEVANLLRAAGFGRTDIRPVTSSGVSDYLVKHALKAYRGLTARERRTYQGMRLRLVNTSRGLPRLDDYRWTSDLVERTKALRDRIRATIARPTRHDFRRIHQAAELCALLGFDSVPELNEFLRDELQKM